MVTLSFVPAQERVLRLLHELGLVSDDCTIVVAQPEPSAPSVNEPEPEPERWIEPERLWIVRPKQHQSLSERVALQRNVISSQHQDEQSLPRPSSINKSKAADWHAEGLYVSLKPEIATENIDLVTGRICREKGNDQSFYDNIESDPSLQLRLRIVKDEKYANGSLPIKIVRPVRISDGDTWLSLKLDLNRIVFHMHDLFTQEDALSAELENLMEQYQQRAVVNLHKYHSERIRFLRQLALKESDAMAARTDQITQNSHRKRLVSILENILSLTKCRDLEQGETRFLFARIYDVWQNLKEWRRRYSPLLLSAAKQSQPGEIYFGTKLRLHVKEIPHDYDRDQREWNHDLEQSVEDLAILHVLRSQIAGDITIPGFDYEQARTSISKQMRLNRRKPGQPDYEPILDRSHPVTADEYCSPWEVSRRNRIRSSHIALKLYVNGKKVCQTQFQPTTFPGFFVQFNQAIELKVLSVPDDIAIKISRQDSILKRQTLLSTIFVGVPAPDAASVITEYTFAQSSKIVIPERDECELWPPSSEPRVTSGDLFLSVTWDENISPKLVKGSDAAQQRLNIDKVAGGDWVKDLDPNDPRNLPVLELHRRLAAQQSSQFFESWTLMPELSLIDPQFAVKSVRRQFLTNRNQRHLFDDLVPLLDDQVPDYMFEPDLDHIAHEEQDSFVTNLSEVVRENALPQMTVSSNLFESLCTPSRKLRPDRGHRNVTGNPSACSIIIQVIRAQNVPIRRDPNRKSRSSVVTSDYWKADRDGVDISDFNERVESMVEISFQQETKSTGTVMGPHPSWNETVVLPLHPPNGSFSPSSILSMRDELTLNLFDLFKSQERAHDSRLTNTSIHRVEKRWLGRVSIPLTTIYLNQTIEGHLRVQTPLTNLGYECVETTRPTVLYIFATLDPLLALPQEPPVSSEWAQKARLYRYASDWLLSVKSLPQCKGRLISALVQDITGSVAFMPHFVTPLPPPLSLTEEEYIRFVSRIPFLQDIHLGESSPRDIWCSSSEFLELLAGDWEEHAILLANYFLASEALYQSGVFVWHTYIIMGMAIPEGRTCMVMRNKCLHGIVKETQLINAVTGDKYDSSDALCPLVSVGCVFNYRNIWANIQAESSPSKISYQLDNASFWRPFFTRSFPEPKTSESIYRNPPVYLVYPDTYYAQRAQAVERIIERQFISWRALPTYFDHGVSQILRETLQSMEFVAQGRSALPDNKDIDKIRSLFTGMYGFPICFPDAGDDCILENTIDNPIVRALHEMKFHDNDNQSMTFARAVYIYPYPNGVGSLWMYFVALITIN